MSGAVKIVIVFIGVNLVVVVVVSPCGDAFGDISGDCAGNVSVMVAVIVIVALESCSDGSDRSGCCSGAVADGYNCSVE